MDVIKFAPDLFDLIMKGRKTRTIREGIRAYTLGDAIFETADESEREEGFICGLRTVKFKDLTDEDAIYSVYDTVDNLKDRLLDIYPDLKDFSDVTVVDFKLKMYM